MPMAAKSRRKNDTSSSTSKTPPSDMNIGAYVVDDNDNMDQKYNHGRFPSTFHRSIDIIQSCLRIFTSMKVSITAIVFIIAASVFDLSEATQSKLIQIGTGYLFIAKPLLSTLAICLSNKATTAWHERIIATGFLMSIICNQFPKWLSSFVAASAVFAFGLASRQFVPMQQLDSDNNTSSTNSGVTQSKSPAKRNATTSSDDNTNPFLKFWSRLNIKERAAIGTLAVVVSLLTENFLIWVVSATYKPGIVGSPTPLQDNGRIVLEALAKKLWNVEQSWMAKRPLQKIRDTLNVQYALVSALGASFVCLELQLGGKKTSHRSLTGVALHALITLASARLIRYISFVLTVLPSQVPNCYRHHFPPPPDNWKDWILVGMLPSSRGGCNDLILSGHATVTSTIACAATSVSSNTSFSFAVWTLIALDYSIEAYQGLHYSVDMFLGGIVTCLLWHLTAPLEIEGELEQLQKEKRRKEGGGGNAARAPPLDATVVAMYAAPAILAFLILAVFPEAYVNYFAIGYSLVAGVMFKKDGFSNLLQHELLCMLMFTIGVYL
ncbi:sphingomyelin synthase family protein [Skeletonema marinoi]|uniref:Sphingomyelin synthase family protein n=1 Tax=Skeletonema marinoi TaxID=267567 RepID=A0AAD9DAV9_9STRA|nr:sphingomyelin synthase family protein [Skeletonema marinoi]